MAAAVWSLVIICCSVIIAWLQGCGVLLSIAGVCGISTIVSVVDWVGSMVQGSGEVAGTYCAAVGCLR